MKKTIKIELEKFKTFKLINFTDLNKKERLKVLKLRNHKNVRKWMYNPKKIRLKEHINFIKSLKKNPKKRYFLVKKGAFYIGVIDFTKIDKNKKECYFGIYANLSNKKPSLGSILQKIAIKYALKHLKLKTLKLEVLSNNKRAINLYKKFKFKETERKKFKKHQIICMQLSLSE